MIKDFYAEKLKVKVFENRTLMGNAAAADIQATIKELLSKKMKSI